MNIAILTGELSGDLLGAALARELLPLLPDAKLWGMGSGAMREAGVELLFDSASWGVIGIVEALGIAPTLLLDVLPKMKRALRQRRPDVVVLIDFGAFNVLIARYCKRLGLKVCFYFPPGAWRREGVSGSELAHITDLLIVPFPWAAERFAGLGARVENVGHPLLERVRSDMTRAEFAAQFGMDPSLPIIGLLPGSRRFEVMHLMPAMLGAARIICREIRGAQFVVGVAPSISPEMMAGYLTGENELRERLAEIWHEFTQEAETRVWKRVTRTADKLKPTLRPQLATSNGMPLPDNRWKEQLEQRRMQTPTDRRSDKGPPPTVLAKGMTYEVMAHSDVLLLCSGTATLEATIFTTPMVILYRGSKIMELEYRLRGIRKKTPQIGLPNILAGHRIMPELIQDEANPEAIATEAIKLLNDITIRQQARSELKSLRDALGEPGASARAAQLVANLALPNR